MDFRNSEDDPLSRKAFFKKGHLDYYEPLEEMGQ